MTDTEEKNRRLAEWHELLSGTVIGGSLGAWHLELRHEVDQMKATN